MKTIRILTTLMMATALLLTACTKDDAGQESVVTPTPQPADGQKIQLEAVTRGDATPVTLENIKVLMTSDTKPGTYHEGSFVRTSNGWDNYVSVSEKNYHVYGYMPGQKFNATLSARPGTTGFSTGAVMTFTDLPAVIGSNLCVITSVRNKVPSTNDPFVLGNYAFQNLDNKISLHLDHLYASLVFQVSIGSGRNYCDLRTIKLTALKLRTKKLQEAAVTFVQGRNLTDADIQYTYAAGDEKVECLFYEDGGVLSSPTDLIKATSFFVPALYNDLELVAIYDVYDKKGNLVHANRKAINKLTVPKLGRGQQYTINLTVEPTYLGQLSDGDLDNPDVKIN